MSYIFKWFGVILIVSFLSGCATEKKSEMAFSEYSINGLQIKQMRTPLGGRNYEFCPHCVNYSKF